MATANGAGGGKPMVGPSYGPTHSDVADAKRTDLPSGQAAGGRRPAAAVAPIGSSGDRGRDPSQAGATADRALDASHSGAPSPGIGPPGPVSPSDIPPDARRIVRQVATHPVLQTGGSAEVRLAPEELGHLRLSVEMGEGGLRVVIEAARPETCELMRRHVDTLRQELRQEGLGSVSVSIGGGEGRRGEDQGPSGRPAERWPAFGDRAAAADPGLSDLPLLQPAGTTGHLDLRF